MRKRPRSLLEGTFIEKFFYELKPFLLLAGGSYILKVLEMHTIGRIGATILLLCGIVILVERAIYRGYLR